MSEVLSKKLQNAKHSGVYRARSVEPLVAAARGSKLDVVKIRLAEKQQLFDNIAKALAFPKWFGGNWDALEDCLSDLSWRDSAGGHVLVFEGEPAMQQDELGVLIDVLSAVAEFWAGEGRPFFAVFIDPGRKLGVSDL